MADFILTERRPRGRRRAALMPALGTILLYGIALTQASPWGDAQEPLLFSTGAISTTASPSPAASPTAFSKPFSGRKLTGKFLHITDPHPDSHFAYHSSTDDDYACHRGSGRAGTYGAEISDCDSPFSLINETFKWIDANLRDSVDFVIWTGDSARHDNDEKIPRTEEEVLSLNRYMVQKVVEVFGKKDKVNDTEPEKDLIVPVIPNLGNNDILPHNVFTAGPNRWTKAYATVWDQLIPEEQRHAFERGGWFFVEVIPNRLAVFSLNTLYFYDKNAAVDGCADESEPGYEQMEWLRVQLQFLRDRGMKAILTGHVPPARTSGKNNWDESCWQKYTLWLERYRDVIVAAMYGHMNIDHFMLQDTRDVVLLDDAVADFAENRTSLDVGDGDPMLLSTTSYISELKDYWSELPRPPASSYRSTSQGDQSGLMNVTSVDPILEAWKRNKEKRYNKKIGGPWGERYAVALVSPSIIPNYFPTLRVFDYNITSMEEDVVSDAGATVSFNADVADGDSSVDDRGIEPLKRVETEKRKKKHKKRKGKKPKTPSFTIPTPPTKGSPPGPAYSPQRLTLLGYTQYYANLTYINNERVRTKGSEAPAAQDAGSNGAKQRRTSKQRRITGQPTPNPFEYQVEYSTSGDSVYKMKDLTVRSYLKLAWRIGHAKPDKGAWNLDVTANDTELMSCEAVEPPWENKHKRHRKHGKVRPRNKAWYTFIKRAFVGAVDDGDLQDRFGLAFPCDVPVEADVNSSK
ncbi:MAG: Endopolyphosphatase [Thelocarpon impressellum]|nr:MAG: Endopolyphosphatase [Thelocarpon impressellum]